MHHRYDCPEIRQVWSDEYRLLLWTKIELSFLRHLKGVDVPVPDQFQPKWMEQVAAIEERTRHDVGAFVEWLEAYVRASHGDVARYVHYGLTSSDIVDTAFTLQIAYTNTLLAGLVARVEASLLRLREKYGATPMVGRTHGQAAERIHFRNKLDSYMACLAHFSTGGLAYYGKLSGSVGDSKYFSTELAGEVLQGLGLTPCPLQDGQIIHRSVYADHMNRWAVLASVVGKIATDVRLLAQTGIEELQEGFGKSQMGSSSMPQKRNPIYAENLCGLARVLRGYQAVAMQNIELWNERDISHSSAERLIFPDASVTLGFMLVRLERLLDNLQVNTGTMAKNLDECNGRMDSQAEMLRLIDAGMSRAEAHAEQRRRQGL